VTVGVAINASLPVASSLQAICYHRAMKTLYLRNVPDDVVQRLERLAKRERTSVSALAVRELAEASRRVDNLDLLGALPNVNVDVAELVADIDAERAGR
jgi:hypothetical protein